MGRRRTALGGLLALVAVPGSAQVGGPVVLHDTGRTQPLAPYYARVKPESVPPPVVSRAIPPHRLRLPITTDLMTPGTVQPRPLPNLDQKRARRAIRPLFLFGADLTSLAWVRHHRDRLKALRAVGMLIEARTDLDVDAVREAIGDLPMFGGSANDIASALKLKHYPVLITADGIEQ